MSEESHSSPQSSPSAQSCCSTSTRRTSWWVTVTSLAKPRGTLDWEQALTDSPHFRFVTLPPFLLITKDDLCNGNSCPFEPPKGIDKGLCERNYSHSHFAIVFQWVLLGLNISQLLFHHFGMPEPKITAKRFEWDYTHGLRSKMKSQAGNTTPNSAQDYFDESSPLLSNRSPISARQFYRLKKEHSSDDLEAQYYSGAKL